MSAMGPRQVNSVTMTFAIVSILAVGAASSPRAPQSGQVWAARYDGTAHGVDFGMAVAVSPDGNRVFVTGQTDGLGTGEDAGTVAYDASTGGQLWETSYDVPGDAEATAIAVTPLGTAVFVTGVGPGASGQDYVTIAYDAATGAQLWAESYNGPGNGDDVANAISVSPSGSDVFVTGRSPGSGSGDDYATVAYSASTGSQQWAKRFQSPGSADDTAYDIGVSPDGARVFVTGQVAKQTDAETWGTVAYDAGTGGVLWNRRYGQGAGYDNEAYALAVSPDGSKLFVGGSVFSASLNDMGTVAYDAATGAQEWAKRYDSHGYDYVEDMATSPDGATVFVTGEGDGGPTLYDFTTLAYSASTGAPLWKRSYDGPRHMNDLAYSIAASPDGSSVYVTGRSLGTSATGVDYATLAYDAATGANLWTERYNGSGNGVDEAHGLAVSPHGSKVFVTGQSLGSSTSWDYATVAYSA